MSDGNEISAAGALFWGMSTATDATVLLSTTREIHRLKPLVDVYRKATDPSAGSDKVSQLWSLLTSLVHLFSDNTKHCLEDTELLQLTKGCASQLQVLTGKTRCDGEVVWIAGPNWVHAYSTGGGDPVGMHPVL
jgi:hypothetical protein